MSDPLHQITPGITEIWIRKIIEEAVQKDRDRILMEIDDLDFNVLLSHGHRGTDLEAIQATIIAIVNDKEVTE